MYPNLFPDKMVKLDVFSKIEYDCSQVKVLHFALHLLFSDKDLESKIAFQKYRKRWTFFAVYPHTWSQTKQGELILGYPNHKALNSSAKSQNLSPVCPLNSTI